MYVNKYLRMFSADKWNNNKIQDERLISELNRYIKRRAYWPFHVCTPLLTPPPHHQILTWTPTNVLGSAPSPIMAGFAPAASDPSIRLEINPIT